MPTPRSALTGAGSRLRRHGGSVIVAAIAAAVSYAVAALFFGADNAFFAPIAAVICVGLSGGERILRSLEVLGGVFVGVIAGEVVSLIPVPTVITLGATVALGMGAALALRATALFTNQAAVAAVVTTVLTPITQAPPFLRLADALVGGIVALMIALVATLRPERRLSRTVAVALEDLADLVTEVAQGLRHPESDLTASVRRLIGATDQVPILGEAVDAARESLRLGRRRRRTLARLRERAKRVRDEWLPLIISLVAMARAARAVRRDGEDEESAAAHVDEVARAVRAVAGWATEPASFDSTAPVRRELQAMGRSFTAELDGAPATSTRVLLVACRTTMVDLLRMTGLPHDTAVTEATRQ